MNVAYSIFCDLQNVDYFMGSSGLWCFCLFVCCQLLLFKTVTSNDTHCLIFLWKSHVSFSVKTKQNAKRYAFYWCFLTKNIEMKASLNYCEHYQFLSLH